MEYRTIKVGKGYEKFAIVCVECGSMVYITDDADSEPIGENEVLIATDERHNICLECECGNKIEF